MNPKSAKERFEMKFVKGSEAECWNWLAAKSHGGYGKLMVDTQAKKFERSHRLSYMYYVGDIPEGMIVRHKCDNPSCVNPFHLELGTVKDNVHDAIKRGRFNPRGLATPKLKSREKRRNNVIGEKNISHKLTDAQVEEIRQLKRGGLSTTEIAEVFEVSQSHVSKICRHEVRNIATNYASTTVSMPSAGIGDARRKVTPEMESEILELFSNGKTHQQIADAVGLTQGHVSVVLQKLNGGKKQKPRLTEETISNILRLREQGLSFAKIGEAVGVPKPTVQSVLKRKVGN